MLIYIQEVIWIEDQGGRHTLTLYTILLIFRTSFSFSLWLGRMRPFYQTHWDISNDIKHVWLLFCTYYIAWVFQWILGDEEQYRVWTTRCVEGGRWWDRQEIVPVDSGGPFVLSRGGGPDILAPGLQHRMGTSALCTVSIHNVVYT